MKNSEILPDKSQASLSKGIWLVCTNEQDTIKIFGGIAGKEKIFLNEELVSEQRSMNLTSSHQFQNKQGDAYEVTFSTASLIKFEMECLITKNNERIKLFTVVFHKGNNLTLKRMLLLIITPILFGLASHYFKWSDFTFYIFLAIAMTLFFATRDPGKITIHESDL